MNLDLIYELCVKVTDHDSAFKITQAANNK